MGYAILNDVRCIREKLRELFTVRTRSRRRVILEPWVGLAAFDHFPDVQDVDLYCWGQDDLPDPTVLAQLVERGAKVHQVAPLNLKLYWVKGAGAVIGPSNWNGSPMAAANREVPEDLALYFDAAALNAVDEMLGYLLLEPTRNDSFADLEESCALFWRLAGDIIPAAAVTPYVTEVVPVSPKTKPGSLSPGRRRRDQAQNWWQAFLEEESREDDGLLCFYDRPRTRRVEHLCRVYAARMGVLEEERTGEEGRLTR